VDVSSPVSVDAVDVDSPAIVRAQRFDETTKSQEDREATVKMRPEVFSLACARDPLDYGGYRTSQRRTRSHHFLLAVAMALCLGSAGVAHAQSTTWDSMLSNSYWYVPQENLLAYMTSGTSFTTPTPSAGSDQTLWSLGTATNGTFTGTAVATFRPSGFPLLSITSTMTIA
jgi:hypothetical protein